ncbi:MAG: ATP synthase F1 subunit epsilon [Bacteroidia bacterium]|nr:ATP synthase F1 subunit epsilon [Bacteroidia bacterium]
MYVEIITPDKMVFAGECTAVQVPGTNGKMQFLNNHAPLISTLGSGQVRVKTAQGQQAYQILGGVVEVLKNKVVVLAERVD